MRDDVEIFLERAKKFEVASKYFAEQSVYDLAAFHIEQAFQLYLKYILAKELGHFPKTHSLSALFKGVSKIDERFFEFYKDNEIVVKVIEDAYILSRYYPREYSKEEISKMMEVLNRFKEVFKKWIS